MVPTVPRERKFLSILATCHAERSEASVPVSCQTLRGAQGDMVSGWEEEEDLLPLQGYQSSAADTAIAAGSGLAMVAATSGR